MVLSYGYTGDGFEARAGGRVDRLPSLEDFRRINCMLVFLVLILRAKRKGVIKNTFNDRRFFRSHAEIARASSGPFRPASRTTVACRRSVSAGRLVDMRGGK